MRPKSRIKRLSNGMVQRDGRIVRESDLHPQEKEELEARESAALDVNDLLDPKIILNQMSEISGDIDSIIKEVDKKSSRINVQALKLKLNALAKQYTILETMLDKSLADKREVTLSLGDHTSFETLPNDILLRAAQGNLSEEEQQRLELLYSNNSEETVH